MTEKTLQASKLIPKHVYGELALTKGLKTQYSTLPPSNAATEKFASQFAFEAPKVAKMTDLRLPAR